MKKERFVCMSLLLSAFLAFTSCEVQVMEVKKGIDEVPTDPQPNETVGTISVDCSYEQYITPMAPTRAGDTSTTTSSTEVTVKLSDVVKTIYYIAMQNGTIVSKTIQHADTDENFGKLDLDLEVGEYTLVVFANKDSNDTEISESGLVSIRENCVFDSFVYSQDIVVSAYQRTAVTAALNRCVSRIYFKSKDKMSAEVTSLKMTVENTPTQYDLKTLCGVRMETLERTINLENYDRATNGNKFSGSVYLYMPATTSTVNATLAFYNEEEELYTRYLEDIKVEENRKTNVSANFFTKAGFEVADFTISYTWLNDFSQEY